MAKTLLFSIFFFVLIIAPITPSFGLSSPFPSPTPSHSPYSSPSSISTPPPSNSPFDSPYSSPSSSPSPSDSPYSSPSSLPSPSPSDSPYSSPSSSSSPSPTNASIVFGHGDDDDYLPYKPKHEFISFKHTFGKSYDTKEEEDYRYIVFLNNIKLALRNNKLDPHAAHGVTKFSDLTQEEFFNTFLGGEAKYMHDHRPLLDHDMAYLLPTTDFPELYNWRHEHDSGAPITITTDNLVVAVSSHEDQIKANLLKYGPLAVGFDASFMQTFFGGTSCPTTCSNQHNHGALLIGYQTYSSYIEGDEPDIPYWIFTNSRYPPGPDELDEGYYSICRGQNVCGVESMVSTVPAALSNTT